MLQIIETIDPCVIFEENQLVFLGKKIQPSGARMTGVWTVKWSLYLQNGYTMLLELFRGVSDTSGGDLLLFSVWILVIFVYRYLSLLEGIQAIPLS